MSKVIKKFVKNGEEYNIFPRSSITVIEGEPSNAIDARIASVRPEATPIDQISRYIEAQEVSLPVFEYNDCLPESYPTKTILTQDVSYSNNTSVTLNVQNPDMFNIGDVISVVGQKAVNEVDFELFTEAEREEFNSIYSEYDIDDPCTPDLMLYVCDKTLEGQPIVFAINGNMINNQPIGLPGLSSGTVLVRLGNAGSINQSSSGRQIDTDGLVPTKRQSCQKLMWPLPLSTVEKLASESQDIDLSDAEEFLISNMRLDIEKTFLFSDRSYVQHAFNDGDPIPSTKGIWWQAARDIEAGMYSPEAGTTVISDNDLVDISKDVFDGTGVGNKLKVLLCGSGFFASLVKDRGNKYSMNDTVEVWGIKFKLLQTAFGDFLVANDRVFDSAGMSDCAFAFDPDCLSKHTYEGLSSSILDPYISQDETAYVHEFSGLCLTNPKAHCRIRLAQNG